MRSPPDARTSSTSSSQDCRNVTDGGLEAVAAGCPNLQHLNLSWCSNVTDGGVEAVAAGCPNLQHLDLSLLQQRDGRRARGGRCRMPQPPAPRPLDAAAT